MRWDEYFRKRSIDGQVIPGITNADGHIAPRGYSSDPAPKPGTTAAPKTNLLVALEQEGTDANGNVIRKGATFTGNKDRDIMLGGDGENTMNGDKGNDIMVGGNKKDTMNGGDDNDILIGRDGNDELNGGNGNDTLFGGKGKDTLKGGTGEDTYVFAFEDIDGDVISDPDGGGKIKIDQRLLGNLGKIEYGGGATWTEKRGDYSLTYKLLNHKPAKNGNSDTSVGDLQITVTQGGESKYLSPSRTGRSGRVFLLHMAQIRMTARKPSCKAVTLILPSSCQALVMPEII